jgi:hypothetical protein
LLFLFNIHLSDEQGKERNEQGFDVHSFSINVHDTSVSQSFGSKDSQFAHSPEYNSMC